MMPECSVCGGHYDGFGNNAAPFPGRCCNDCDNRFVIPARILGVDDVSLLIHFARLGRIINTRVSREVA